MSITDGSKTEKTWPSWTLAEWNERLFKHVFERRGAESLYPVVRIPVTQEFLALATGTDVADAQLIRSEFIQHFRLSRSEFNQLFRYADPSSLDPTKLPSCFAKLVLTLLVASACSETSDEGDFRKRLAIEVGHPSGTQYNLSGLPMLWQGLQAWLQSHSAEYRELNLPDPGRRDTIIGYSKGLTFPTFRDYQALTRILEETQLAVEDSPLEIIDAVRSSQPRFTRSFLHAVDEFVLAYSEGQVGVRNHPFWSAVRSIAWDRTAAISDPTRIARYSLHLSLADPLVPIVSLLTSTIEDSDLTRGFRKAVLAPPLGNFRFAITTEGSGFHFRLSEMLRFPDFSRSSLAAALRVGCICFADDESGERIFQPTCPDDPEVFLALNEARFRQVSRILEQWKIEVVHRTELDGTNWRLLGSVPGKILMRLGQQILSTDPILALTPRLAEPSIRLHDSCRVGDSYLLRFGVYPAASCPEADGMEAVPITTSTPVRIRLERSTSDENDTPRFRFPRNAYELLSPPREIELVATLNEIPIARRTVHACALVASTAYKEMTESSAWVVEGNRGHLEEQDSPSRLPEYLYKENPELKRLVRGVVYPRSMQAWNDASPTAFLARPGRVSGLLEVLAARSVGRQGLTEPELVSLIRDYLLPEPRWLVWDLLRSLVENWHLDGVTARRWGSRKYFAIRPFLCRDEQSGNTWLLGLTPALKLAELANCCTSVGIKPEMELDPEQRMSLGPIRLASLDTATASRLADKLAVKLHSLEHLPLGTPKPLRDIADWSEQDRNDDGVRYEQTFWNWTDGHFAQEAEDAEVILRRRVWNDRPDEYRISIRSSSVSWLTLSRTWALLMAHGLARKPQFWLTQTGDIFRADNTQGYLPIRAARLLCLHGGPSGLCEGEGGIMRYVYSGSSNSIASSICASLLEVDCDDRLTMALKRWRKGFAGRGRHCGSTGLPKNAQLAQSSQ